VVGKDKKMGGFVYEGLYPEDSFLEKGFGGDQFEEVFGFGFTTEGPKAFATSTGHNEEKERRHWDEIKMNLKTKGVGNFL